MTDDPSRNHKQLAKHEAALPVEPGLARKALAVNTLFGALSFRLSARANMMAMQTAMQHAKVFGELMDVVVQTTGKVQKVQDSAREFSVRQELSPELYAAEVDRLRSHLEEGRHQDELAVKRRQVELIKSDTEMLAAQQAQEEK